MSEHITPGRCADGTRQYVPGINGEMLEVTSISRPDTGWSYQDGRGHRHQWYTDGQPASSYSPRKSYSLPTLTMITDVEGDDEHPGRGHYECTACLAIELEG